MARSGNAVSDAEVEGPAAHVALAWAMARPGISSTIIRASKVAQVESNVAAAGIRLSDELMKRLDEARAPPLGFQLGPDAAGRPTHG